MVATTLPPKIAESNRRQAKTNRDKRVNHSKEYYFPQGFCIYLTNVDSETWNKTQVPQVYRLRWRIERIFKCWKSCFNFDTLIHHQCTSVVRIECFALLMLTFLVVYHSRYYLFFKNRILAKTGKYISPIKTAVFFTTNLHSTLTTEQWEELIVRQCLYESRKDRMNFELVLHQDLS
jgi:hypothetical protein